MKLKTSKEELLQKFAAVRRRPVGGGAVFRPELEHMGSGLRLQLMRLLTYRSDYIRHIIARVRRSLVSRRVVGTATTFWGRQLVLPQSDATAKVVHESGTLDQNEDSLIQYLIKELKEDDVFYDIGANYGFYSTLAQEIIVTGEIHVFEPSSSVFPHLAQIEHGYCPTILNRVALSDVQGEVTFLDCADDSSSGKSTIETSIAAKHRWNYKATTVPAITLDEYCQTHKHPTFIKIDVEGAESKVLAGGKSTLLSSAPRVAIELWSGAGLSELSLRALDLLDELGYEPFFITETGQLSQTTAEYLRTWLSSEQKDTNFLFKKKQ